MAAHRRRSRGRTSGTEAAARTSPATVEMLECRLLLDASGWLPGAPPGAGQDPGPLAGMIDDEFEDNDSVAEAADLGAIEGEVWSDTLVLADDDWYSFVTLDTGGPGDYVAIEFLHALGDLDLMLVSEDGQTELHSQTEEDFEEISLEGLPAGLYYVRAYGYEGATNDAYWLGIGAPFGGGGADDAFEDNDFADEAADLGGLEGENLWDGLVLADDDWYAFQTLQAGGPDHYVAITFDGDLGDIDMALYSEDGQIELHSDSPYDYEEIELNGLPAGTYFLVVYGYDGATNPDYSLVIDAPAGGAVVDDAFEENDTWDQPADLGIVEGENVWIDLVLEDDDWYLFTMQSPGTAGDYVAIDFFHQLGDLDLGLVHLDSGTEWYSESAEDWEEISLSGLPAGDYLLVVYGYQQATNPDYWLIIDAPVSEDPAPPTVTAFNGDDAGVVLIDFSEPMLTENVDNGWDIWVLDGAQDEVPGWIEWSANDTRISWRPVGLPPSPDDWTIVLAGQDDSDFVDLSWNVLDGDGDGHSGGDYVRTWAVGGGAADAVPPTVLKFEGKANGTAVVDFNEAILTAEVENGWDVLVVNGDGELVEGGIAWSNGDQRLTWQPDQAPLGGDAWTIGLFGEDGGVMDLARNPLDGDADGEAGGLYVGSWDVGGEADTTPPAVTKFDAFADGRAAVTFSESMLAGNVENGYDVYVTAPDGTNVAGSIAWSNNNTKLTWQSAAAPAADATWTITLAGQDAGDFVDLTLNILDGDGDGAAGGDYANTWEVTGGGGTIPADGFEENDVPAQARKLEAPQGSARFTDLTMNSPGDDDWYWFVTQADGTASDSVIIDFTHDSGDLDLYLYSDGGADLLAASETAADQEKITLDGLATGTYYVKVAGEANRDYSLTVQLPAGAGAEDLWTVLYYHDGDCNLDEFIYKDFERVEQLNLPSTVNVVAQFDRFPGLTQTQPPVYDDWSDTRRGVMVPDAVGGLGDWLQSIGEKNMGDPDTLTEFIQWGVQQAPAQHYLLVIQDHGGDVEGACWDDTDNNDHLSLQELHDSIAAAGVHLDILQFFTCLEGTIEVASAVQDQADYLVASEEVMWIGISVAPSLEIFETMAGSPVTDIAAELARIPVADTVGQTDNGQPCYTTGSVTDLSRIGALNDAIAAFVQVCHVASADDWNRIGNAAANTYHFAHDYMKDLARFMRAVNNDNAVSAGVRGAAGDVLDAFDDAIVANYANNNVGDGLSVALSAQLNVPVYASLAGTFVAATQWDTFLNDLSGSGAARGAAADWAEPNDTRSTAYLLPRAQGESTTLDGLKMDGVFDVDWFRLETAGTGEADSAVGLDSTVAGLDLTCSLYDAAGNLLGTSAQGGTAAESVSLTGRPAGLYYVKVTCEAQAGSGEYQILLSTPLAPEVADWAGSNHTQDRAYELALSPGDLAPYIGLMADASDDWFYLELTNITNGPDGYVQLQCAHAEMSLEVYDADGQLLDQGGDWTDGGTTYDLPADAFTTLYFKASVDQGSHPYSIMVQAPSYDIAGAGEADTETLTLGEEIKQVVYYDEDGTKVTVKVKGLVEITFAGEEIEVDQDGNKATVNAPDGARIDAIDILAETKSLTFKTDKGGNAAATIEDLTGDFQLNKLSGKAIDLIGGGIDMPDGVILSIQLRNILGDVTMGAAAAKGVSFKVSQSIEDADITMDGEVAKGVSFKVSQSIEDADITIGGAVAKGVSFKVGESIEDTDIRLGASDLKSLTVDSLVASNVFAGVAPGVTGLPDPAEDFLSEWTIKKLTVKDEFADSSIAAAHAGKISLRNVQVDNPTPFGLAAVDVKSLKVKQPEGTFKYGKDKWDEYDWEDFEVELIEEP